MLHVVLYRDWSISLEKALKLFSTLYSDCNATSLQATSINIAACMFFLAS